jgi:LysR family transcriptional regulator, benzoate and cis,cis-muconate-responsive activator of ben and cat genes
VNLALRHLRTFLAVAEFGSFTAAATKLNVEISAVSRAIRDLENELKVVLFYRHPRGTRLTTAGNSLHTSATAIIAALEDAVRDARAVHAGSEQKLNLGAFWLPAGSLVSELLRTFRERCPSTYVHLLEDGPSALMSRLAAGRLDAFLTALMHNGEVFGGDLPGLCKLPLWLDRSHVIAPPQTRMDSITFAELADHDILYRQGDEVPLFGEAIVRAGGPQLRFVAQDCSHQGLVALVAAGMGWSIAPETFVQSTQEVRFLPVTDDLALLRTALVWRKGANNPALSAFVGHAQSMFSTEYPSET